MTTQAIQERPAHEVNYQVAGQEIKLTYNNVRQFLTKGNGAVTDTEVGSFITLCRYNSLNPFLNEAYLVKFGSQPAQMIVSKEAYFKRAEANPEYDGIESGVIIQTEAGEIQELAGGFVPPRAYLLGAWAKVYRKNYRVPVTTKVNLSEYDKGQSIWKEKKATMIEKVAKVQALREAFPSQLGAMYTEEETRYTSYEEVKQRDEAVEQTATAEDKVAMAMQEAMQEQVPIPEPEPEAEPAAEPKATKTKKAKTEVETEAIPEIDFA